MTANDWITLTGSGGAVILTLALRYLDRRKHKAEASVVEQEVHNKLMQSVRAELDNRDLQIDELRNREKDSKRYIKAQKEIIANLRLDRLTCDEKNQILQMQVDAIQKLLMIYMDKIVKMNVFILDDSAFVTEQFKQQLQRHPLITVTVSNDSDNFIEKIREVKPSLLVLDYYLKGGETCDGLIKNIQSIDSYFPKILVMTNDQSAELKQHIAGLGIERMYSKENLFVFEIVKHVIKYAETILT